MSSTPQGVPCYALHRVDVDVDVDVDADADADVDVDVDVLFVIHPTGYSWSLSIPLP